MTRFVGLDPSTKTGVVILDSDGRLIDGMEISPGGKDPARMLDIIESTIDELEPNDIVAIEGFGFASQSGFLLGGIGWGIRLGMFTRSIRYDEVAPNALKKFAGAKGNAKKDELAVHIFKRWGFEHPSDNVRDAFILAQIARSVYLVRKGLPIDLTAFQSAVVQTIITPPSKGKRGA